MITTIQQTVTAALYASGNAVGGKITLTDLFPAGSEYNCAITDVVLVTTGAPTYASTSDILLRITTEKVYV